MSERHADIDPYLTPEQTAKLLHIKANTLAKWRSQGKGPAWRDHGHIVYHIDDLHKWSLDRRRTETKSKRKDPSVSDGGK